jgi:hypothetical protein
MDEQIEAQLQANLWSPDAPDFRDLTLESDEAVALNQFIAQRDPTQTSIDLRELMPPLFEPAAGVGIAANSACTLLEYFRQLCDGDTVRLSRAFVHRVALLLDEKTVDGDLSLRAAFKCLKLVGAPPASLVRSVEVLGKRAEDAPICYQFSSEFANIQYFRIDHARTVNLVERVKSLVSSGIPCVFGMAVPSSIGADSRIELRPEYDSIVGYTAGVIVGFDDAYRISTQGAFCFQSSFSSSWGEGGYGWLSYEMFWQRMVTDIWTALQPSWLGKMSEDRGFRYIEDGDIENGGSISTNCETFHVPAPKGFPGRNRHH